MDEFGFMVVWKLYEMKQVAVIWPQKLCHLVLFQCTFDGAHVLAANDPNALVLKAILVHIHSCLFTYAQIICR